MFSMYRVNLSRSAIDRGLRELALFNGLEGLVVVWKRKEANRPCYHLEVSHCERRVQFDLDFKDIITYPYGSEAFKVRGIMRSVVQQLSQK